jgi:hypothetical protein
VLTLPLNALRSYAGRTLGVELQWGGMTAAGKPVTKVLGETFGRGGSSTGPSAAALPFTGSNVLLGIAAGLLSLCCGLLLVVIGRTGRPKAPELPEVR